MDDIATTLLGLAGLLALVSLLPPLAAKLFVPYSVLLAAIGVALGAAIHVGVPTDTTAGPINGLIDALGGFGLSAEHFLFLFLPVLLFETALSMDVRRLLDDMAPILLLAVVAVLICTFAVGFALWGAGGAGLVVCLLLGAIVATTDPVAVVGIFRDLGAPRRLNVLVEGESLFNDAAAIALFTLLLAMLTGSQAADPAATALAFIKGFLGGVAVGYLLARFVCALVAPLRNLPLSEITMTVSLAYASYILAERYVQVSGVVAVVTAALVVGSVGRTRISPGTWGALVQVWQQLGFWANSLIFLLAAMVVPPMLVDIGFTDLGLLLVLAAAALAARGLVLYGLMPVLTVLGMAARVSTAYKTVMLWGGLRGAVSLTLALAVTENAALPPEVKRFVAVLATGFVLLTLFVNGTSLRPLIRALGLHLLPPAERAMRNRAMALSIGSIRDRVDGVARDYQLDPALAQDVLAGYADRLSEIERDPGEGALSDADRIYIGLITLANREEELYRRHFQENIIGRPIVQVLTAQAGRLIDGAKTGGKDGYQTAALRVLGFSRRFRFRLFLHRRFGFDRPLAGELATRFETLLIMRLALRELIPFNERKLGPLLGAATARLLGEVLNGRLTATEQALSALRLQYPDFARTLQYRYLSRAAMRIEEANHQAMHAESIISREVLNDLERDLGRRRQVLEEPARLDLGLGVARLVARVPIFSDLAGDRLTEIAKLLKPRLAVPEERLVRRGEKGQAMYFVASGTVEVRVPGLAEPIRLGTGDFFGELALLTNQPRMADVVAVGYCQLLELDAREFRRLVARDADLRRHIEATAERRLPPKSVAGTGD